jgi:hypothetical protein
MKKFRNALIIGGGIGVLLLTFGLAYQGSAKAKPSVLDEIAHPFQTHLCDTAPCVASHQDTFSVPSGHRLVIEFVSGRCDVSEATVFLSTTVNGTTVLHNFVPLHTSNANGTEGSFSQPTRLYADPGTNVVVTGDVPFPTCTNVTLSGLSTPAF